MKKIIGWVLAVVVVIIALGAFIYRQRMVPAAPSTAAPSKTETSANATSTLIASATYKCNKGHTIQAAFYQGPASKPQPGEPPIPTGSVQISMDGGATTTLAQTLSADGGRYSDGDPQIKQGKPGTESLVFWSKGNTALIMRDNKMDPTYTNCTTPQQ